MEVRQLTPDVRGPLLLTQPLCRAESVGESLAESKPGVGSAYISASSGVYAHSLPKEGAVCWDNGAWEPLLSYLSQPPCPCFLHLLQAGLTP